MRIDNRELECDFDLVLHDASEDVFERRSVAGVSCGRLKIFLCPIADFKVIFACLMAGMSVDWPRQERWLSGRKRRFAKPLYGQKPYRGFESPPLRHFTQSEKWRFGEVCKKMLRGAFFWRGGRAV